MSWLDLHMHSNQSDDGEYTPEELMELCVQNGVRTAAVADHNSTRAVQRAQTRAEALGITCISGVELDCTHQGVDLHLLGYWIDPMHPGFAAAEQDIWEQEQRAGSKRIELAKALGIQFKTCDALLSAKQGVVTGEMIAEAALEQDPENPLLAPYQPGGARSDNPFVNFYWDFFSQGKPAYVPITFMSLKEAVELVTAAGGVPVLAHPGNNVHENAELLADIAARGVKGLEAYSSYHSPEQTAFYLEQAAQLSLAVSCGSDFHGKIKPSIRLGGTECGGHEAELLRGLECQIPR
ncbi:PHP domain-containing protein [Anaeromassilibacillus senegalensis]|uniref:PHP domain-containing protein n=1 Tax=Anaeromassilibacillus senegalensis TaxID=1673717 RepID=UPI0006801722|nr:PHP domain-containing protein [Anaeromassilibacillus senegalensis]